LNILSSVCYKQTAENLFRPCQNGLCPILVLKTTQLLWVEKSTQIRGQPELLGA
jgi:hypothetical protein